MSAVLHGAGHGLREAGLMWWDTLWALVLGFGLSGAVQAFVPAAGLRSRLGHRRPSAVAGAAALGSASSSCSYAASAMARSLFAKGADFVTAMVFMFASTNLVVELGLVMAVLIGWPFVAAEGVGGVVMIVLLAAVGSLAFGGRALSEARRRAAGPPGPADQPHDDHPGRRPPLRSAAGWAAAAGYAISDLRMLRKELVGGFLAAGFLAALVPDQAWRAVFLHGHGALTTVENAAVGPLVALLSCVCSVGNVPLAAALWKGGISFGGVVSFVFADLIALPLLLVYRRQYGGRMAGRMLLVFWAVMSVSGLVTEGLFGLAGWVPRPDRAAVSGSGLHWAVTSGLDVAALAAFAGLWWLHRQRGAVAGYAIDPVCGMQVRVADAPAHAVDDEGRRVVFCSERCRDRYLSPASP